MIDKLKQLREDAEKILNVNKHQTTDIPVSDFNRIIHDLKVYQIELELQNEELRDTQKQLEASRNRFAQLYNQAPAGYVTLDQNSIVLQANQTFAAMVNKDFSQILNLSFSDFLADGDSSIFLSRFNAFFKQPNEKSMELKMYRSGGKHFFVRITGSLITDDSPNTQLKGRQSKLFLIVSNITEQKIAEESLIESEYNYRTLADSGQALIWTSGNDMQYNYFNTVWLNFTARPLEEELGKGWTKGVHPDDFEHYISIYTNAFEKQQNFSLEYRLRHNSGEYRWLLNEGCPRYSTTGEFIGYIGYCLDITERKKIEMALQERNKELACLSSVRSKMQNDLSIDDFCNEIIKLLIPAMEFPEITCPRIEISGKSFSMCKSIPKLPYYLHSDIKIDGNILGYLRVYYKEDRPFIIPEEQELINNVANSIEIFIEKKRAEEELKLKNEQLEKNNSEKDKFFSIISHDLRSPFHGLMGLTQLLASRATEFSTEEITHFGKILNDSSKNIFGMLENLLQWSKLQRGNLVYMPETLSIDHAVQECVSSVSLKAEQKEITINFTPTGAMLVTADKNMLNTILSNLLTNALKFSHRGGNVNIAVKDRDDSFIELSVRDTGVGIPKEDLINLFKINEKVSNLGTEDEPSSGLGLLLCKEFVETQGGKIWVESERDKGSTFYFTLNKHSIPL